MKKVFVVALLLTLCTGLAFAGSIPTLDFAITPTNHTGTISYAGGSSPLVGTGIPVGSVEGINTSLNNMVTVPIIGGDLEFVTGKFVNSTSNTWIFSPGNTIDVALFGCADIDFDGGTCDSNDIGGVLAYGIFTGNPTVLNLGGTSKIAGAIGLDIKNRDLLAFFGAPDTLYNFELNYSFKAAGAPPSAFSSTFGGSGDFINQPVPEPASLMLLGAGLLGLATMVRRKLVG